MTQRATSLIPEATEQVRLFHVSVPQEAIDDLRARLRATRFPNEQPVQDWSRGFPSPTQERWYSIGNLAMTGDASRQS